MTGCRRDGAAALAKDRPVRAVDQANSAAALAKDQPVRAVDQAKGAAAADPRSAVGRVNSLESFGAADGPGVRYVIFLQGCPMRCCYCHNPETWDFCGGTDMTVNDIMKRAMRFAPYWKRSGGITVSGGEPLCQMPFVTDLFRCAKSFDVHTAVDTSGCVYTDDEPWHTEFEALAELTDVFLLDLKHISDSKHRKLTGHTNRNIIAMARWLSGHGHDMWIRHVLVPGVTDDEDDLKRLGEFVAGLETVSRFEVLPYHTLGMFKWERAGIAYPLDGVRTPTEEDLARAREFLGII